MGSERPAEIRPQVSAISRFNINDAIGKVRPYDSRPFGQAVCSHLGEHPENVGSRSSWRRECDWDPTVSEFVATILLGRARLGSNRRSENTRESAPMVRRVPSGNLADVDLAAGILVIAETAIAG